jgi:uncharacterized protein YcbX
VGRLVGLWRYPVKSMAGEPLEAVEVGWHGLAGDRRWAFIRADQPASGFPWVTIRQHPQMWHYRPRFATPEDPNKSVTWVRTRAGRELEVTDPALAAELGDHARVIKQDRGAFDTFPLSLITTRTIAALGTKLAPERFRPNFLVEPTGRAQFPEDRWVGGVLRIGTLRLRLDKRDQRCVMVNIDPTTLRRDPKVLRTIAKERGACAGVYGTTVAPGRVAVGDEVVLEP